MKLWKNTKTLDDWLGQFEQTDEPMEADVALLGSKPIALSLFPRLRGIFRAGIGRENVPIVKAKEQGILVRFPAPSTVEVIFEETANFTCASILQMLYRDLGTLDPWTKRNRLSLNEQTLLVIGQGNIGARVREKMKPLMKVVTFDAQVDLPQALEALTRQSHCVSLHIPGTIENTRWWGKEKLSWMQDGAILINTSRGLIVDEDALFEEIAGGRISAAFDVFWKEPYIGRLKAFHPERFFMTPHVGSTCSAFLAGCARDLHALIEELMDD